MKVTQQSNFEEKRLFGLLLKKSPRMAESYLRNLSSLKAESKYSNANWFEDRNGDLFFRFEIGLPALFVLSETISRFLTNKDYNIPIGGGRTYSADLGLIPTYFSNLNIITCLKLWGNQASGFFSPSSKPLRGEEEIMWQFGELNSNPTLFSSMNFVLKNGANEKLIPNQLRSPLSDCLKYAFWSTNRSGFTCSTHMIHSRDEINSILTVTKNLYIIKHIHESKKKQFGHYSGSVQQVDLEYFDKKNFFYTTSALIPTDIARKLWSEIDTEKNENPIINGIIYTFKEKELCSDSLSFLSVVSDFLPSNLELFKNLMAMLAYEKFYYDKNSFGKIGTTLDLEKELLRKIDLYYRHSFFSFSIFDALSQKMDFLINDLYPVIVKNNDYVFFVHPQILSSIVAIGLEEQFGLKDSLVISNFILLLERIACCRQINEMKSLRFTEESEYFRRLNVDFSKILPVLLKTLRTIELSKLLKKNF